MRVWCGEWEAAIAEARTALVLNPNSAFVISMLGCVLGFGGYRDEAIDRLQQAMRASPHDPLTWLWTFWIGLFRYFRRDFDSSLDAMREVVRMRPGFPSPHQQIAYALAMLGRTGEAAHAITRATAAFPSELARTKDRSPWQQPADFALLREGRRLSLAAAGLPDQ